MKKKVKEVIKEDNEEKDSLLNEIKIKSQAAMEYLMTYGWAILIIALSLVVLYSLGIMNPKNFIPRAPPGSCFVFRPNGPGTTDFVSLQGTCGYLPMYVANFDGQSGFINLGHSVALSPEAGTTGKMTFCMWYKVNSLTNYYGPMLKGECISNGNAWEYTFDQPGGGSCGGQGFSVWNSGVQI